MRLLAALLLTLSLIAAGCGGDDEDEKGGEPAATTQTQAEPGTTTQAAPPPEQGGSTEEDEEAVREAIIKWTFEGECDHMTDKFLEAQTLGVGGDTRQQRCDYFEKQFQKPQYSEDDLKLEDVKVTGTKASLILTSDMAPDIKSKYDLVKNGDLWQIDVVDIQ